MDERKGRARRRQSIMRYLPCGLVLQLEPVPYRPQWGLATLIQRESLRRRRKHANDQKANDDVIENVHGVVPVERRLARK
jgi:hypothetical protein